LVGVVTGIGPLGAAGERLGEFSLRECGRNF
jgi:hypothetical protein